MTEEGILKANTVWSRVCAIALSLLLCISGIMIPESSEASDATDKTNVINKTLVATVTQNGKKVTDTIDPKSFFKVSIKFSFPIIRDDLIDSNLSGNIKDKSQQVDQGDYAIFNFGKNLKPDKSTPDSIPVYINAPGYPDHGRRVGTITLEEQEDGSLYAKMHFNDPNGEFNYETNMEKILTVKFAAKFRADGDSTATPGSEDSVIKILDKEYKLPKAEEIIDYKFVKSGMLDDEVNKDSITWKSTIKKTFNLGKTSLGGEIFSDDLSKVGEYIEGSFKINGKTINDKDIYNKDSKTITYKFPDDFERDNAEISFQTKVPNKDKTNAVTNIAKLHIKDEKVKEAKTTVVVHHPLGISKNLKEIGVNKDTGEKELIWTIVAGAANEDYGPAWIGDILSGSLDGQKSPKRVKLTYEHSFNGKKGTWKKVDSKDITKVANPKAFPVFPEGNDKTCPDLSKYNSSEIYELGKGWHEGTKPLKDGYKPIENHWIFVKNLNGLYRITVKMVYDEDTDIGPLINDAELHVCSNTVVPTKPPIYSGIGTITKKAKKDNKDKSLNQGLLSWTISVDFSKVFPSDDRFVYECFYYGNSDAFKEEKDKLHTDGATISDDVLKTLISGENKNTYFNFNQAYVEKSLKSEKPKDETEGKDENNQTGNINNPAPPEKEPLSEKIIYLYNDKNERVGEIVKVSGFSEIKTYSFTLKTRAQDIIDNLEKNIENNTSGTNYTTYQNTAVLAVGKGDTLKTISAVDRYQLPVSLLGKFALEYDANLKDPEDDNLASSIYTDESKTLNYKDRTVLFRIDVNPQGLNLNDYLSRLSGKKPDGDFKDLEIRDVLEDRLKLEPVEKGGPDYYIYEADPSTPPSHAKAKKLIKPQDAGVSFDKENVSWKFKNYKGKPYIIVIRAKVHEDKFKKLITSTPQGTAISFKNEVALNAGGHKLANAKAYASAKPHMMKKFTPDVKMDKLSWRFEYRPFDIKLKNVVFKDELDKNIGLPFDKKGNILLNNFKVKRSNQLHPDGTYTDFKYVKVVKGTPEDGEVSVNYNSNERTIYFGIPDTPDGISPYSYEFEYQTIIRPVDINATTIKNSVELTAGGKSVGARGDSEIETQQYKAFATIKDYAYFVIKKVDGNGKPLAGAVFQYIDNNNKKIKLVSDSNGMVFVTNIDDGLIEIKEISAPDGYVKLNNPIKVDVKKGSITVISPSDVTGKGTIDSPLIVKNNKFNEPKNPATGDNSFIYLWTMLTLISISLFIRSKRRNSDIE